MFSGLFSGLWASILPMLIQWLTDIFGIFGG